MDKQQTKEPSEQSNGGWRRIFDYQCPFLIVKLNSGLTGVELFTMKDVQAGQGSKRQPPLDSLESSFFCCLFIYIFY